MIKLFRGARKIRLVFHTTGSTIFFYELGIITAIAHRCVAHVYNVSNTWLKVLNIVSFTCLQFFVPLEQLVGRINR
jgi:hypothetical protein